MQILFYFMVFNKACLLYLIWDLKNCAYPFALKMVPVEGTKCLHDFHRWKFKHASVDLELIAIFACKKSCISTIATLQGRLCNEFDSSSSKLKILQSAF